MRFLFSLLVLASSAGCISPADTGIDQYEIANSYRAAWTARYGWGFACERRWQNITVEFVDIARVMGECDKTGFGPDDALACHHASPLDGDTLITVAYNYQPDQNLVHELTHALLLCTYGSADSDHEGEQWLWQSEWANEYVLRFSVIDALEAR